MFDAAALFFASPISARDGVATTQFIACLFLLAAVNAFFSSLFTLDMFLFAAFTIATHVLFNPIPTRSTTSASTTSAPTTKHSDTPNPALHAATLRGLLALAGIEQKAIERKRSEFFCWSEATFAKHADLACLYTASLLATGTQNESICVDITLKVIETLHSMHDKTYKQICALYGEYSSREIVPDIRTPEFKDIFSKIQYPEALRECFNIN